MEVKNVGNYTKQLAIEQFLVEPENFTSNENCFADLAFDNVRAFAKKCWNNRTVGEVLRDEARRITFDHYIGWVMDAYKELVD